MNLPEEKDAYGQIVLAHLKGEESNEIVEQDTGYISVSADSILYLAEYRDWPEHEKEAISRAQERFLTSVAVSADTPFTSNPEVLKLWVLTSPSYNRGGLQERRS